ncbi:Aste57867_22342 [Aphanomyces stellatus]|uniref:Aste57867_22342 protein n=1 Tax=Aphanomyces stellatus TaxID=120398 RepID=A0A485LLR9_9STRA|nr:hypothetical protein As57867_022272 [Aphanomyces stellatus]VFT99005.1 Aste57867_22342 [Aphanomyces stellatus]
MGKTPEASIAPPVSPSATALRFLNTAPKDLIVTRLEVSDLVADRIIDHRLFGGFVSVDDVLEKKILRKKEFIAFKDVLLHATADDPPVSPSNQASDDVIQDHTTKQRGAFSEKSLEKAQRPYPRRVDHQRVSRGHF